MHALYGNGPLVGSNFINESISDEYEIYRERIAAVGDLMLVPDKIREDTTKERKLALELGNR